MTDSNFSHLADLYKDINKRIFDLSHSFQSSRKVTLIAVSKSQPIEAIEELYRLGHRDFGENYVQELVQKATVLNSRGLSGIRWHFIGHLQTNKVKTLIPFVSSIHSVSSIKMALEIAKRWSQVKTGGSLPVFIEVNLDHEKSKSGISPSEVISFVKEVSGISGLRLDGLMCIPASHQDPRQKFAALRELEKNCQPISNGMLSMGMSSDFEIAIQEGATHVRVGTALFGSRMRNLDH